MVSQGTKWLIRQMGIAGMMPPFAKLFKRQLAAIH